MTVITSSRQLAVGRSVRPCGFLTEAANFVFLICLEVALEPFDTAIPLESEDMRRKAVKNGRG